MLKIKSNYVDFEKSFDLLKDKCHVKEVTKDKRFSIKKPVLSIFFVKLVIISVELSFMWYSYS